MTASQGNFVGIFFRRSKVCRLAGSTDGSNLRKYEISLEELSSGFFFFYFEGMGMEISRDAKFMNDKNLQKVAEG